MRSRMNPLQANIDYHQRLADYYKAKYEEAGGVSEQPGEEPSDETQRRSGSRRQTISSEAKQQEKSQDQILAEMHADVAKQLAEVMELRQGSLPAIMIAREEQAVKRRVH